jgi:hypothetical protein
MSVGQKTTKENFMKKKFLFMLIVLLTFSLTFIACDKADEYDSGLTGIWIEKDNRASRIYFDGSGNFTTHRENIPITIGTYRTNENKITTEVIRINLGAEIDIELWYEKGQYIGLSIMDKVAETEEEITKKYDPITSTYFIDGRYLFIIHYNEDNDIDGDPAVYTRN